MSRVLLTGGRAPAALELARHFSAAGWTVVVAESARFPLAAASSSIVSRYRVPGPRFHPAEFAAAIRRVAEKERIDLIVPTCEEVFYLSRFSSDLRGIADLFCPEFALLSRLHHKWEFGNLARSLGLSVPAAWLISNASELDQLPLPSADLVFKPAYSRFAVHTLIRPARAQLASLQPTPTRPWVAQQFIAGRELCSYSLARNGALRAHALYEPVWRAGPGAGIYFQPVRLPAAETFVARVVEATGYTGQIGFDFIENEAGLWALECNPRATSGVHLFARDGGLAAAFLPSAATRTVPSADGAVMLVPAMMTVGLRQALARRAAGRFFKDFLGARDALWSWRDPAPSFHLYLGLAEFVLRGLREGITPRAASTRDLEWDGEAIA